MIKIAIADDEAEFTAQLEKIVWQYFESRKTEYSIQVYNSSGALLWDIEDGRYFDIYIIDIEMPEVSGLKLAYTIRKKYLDPYIIIVTSHIKYCIRGYEHNVWRYIMKDTMQEELPAALDGLMEHMEIREKKCYIIETGSEVTALNYNDIYYLEKKGKYTYFHTDKGEFRARKGIKEVCEELADGDFILTDKAYGVNLNHVLSLTSDYVRLRNGEEVVMSKTRIQSVKKALKELLGMNNTR